MYPTTGFDISASMNAAAFSSSSPPISPTMITCSVCSSDSKRRRMSMKDEPTTGSPPIPTIVEHPSPSCVSSWPIWYVSVPRARHEPDGALTEDLGRDDADVRLPGRQRSRAVRPDDAHLAALDECVQPSISCAGTPSVMQTTVRTPAPMASYIASAANGAGTKTIAVFASVSRTAAATVPRTGMPSTSCPPLPGVTPATTFVPCERLRRPWKRPSEPVSPGRRGAYPSRRGLPSGRQLHRSARPVEHRGLRREAVRSEASPRMRRPSSAFVPSSRTTMGSWSPIWPTACRIPRATSSQRVMPPKMLKKIARTCGSRVMISSASTTPCASPPPPRSQKFAGRPPANVTTSTVDIVRPAPFPRTPTSPSSLTYVTPFSRASASSGSPPRRPVAPRCPDAGRGRCRPPRTSSRARAPHPRGDDERIDLAQHRLGREERVVELLDDRGDLLLLTGIRHAPVVHERRACHG